MNVLHSKMTDRQNHH